MSATTVANLVPEQHGRGALGNSDTGGKAAEIRRVRSTLWQVKMLQPPQKTKDSTRPPRNGRVANLMFVISHEWNGTPSMKLPRVAVSQGKDPLCDHNHLRKQFMFSRFLLQMALPLVLLSRY